MGHSRIIEYLPRVIIPALFDTLMMLAVSVVIGFILGTLLGVALVLVSPKGLAPHRVGYKILNFCVGMLRAFPVIILIVAITPLTKFIVGTSIGKIAAIVPLTLAATPIIARVIEGCLLEVDENVITAAKSFGASNFQIIVKVLFPEALPAIISGMTSTTIICLGFTAVAGAVGAGGLGAVALTYGYQRFDDAIMYASVLILFCIVLLIQFAGKIAYKKFK
jgi:D-methionine transport system permease protein